VKFGVSLGRLNPAFFDEVTTVADQLGFESAWLPEHLVLPTAMAGSPYSGAEHPPVPPTTPIFDAPAYLAFLAGRTEQIRLGTYVYLLGIRHPFVTARAFATLDVVSGGRAEVGVGAGWLASEWDAVGLDFATRGRRLDEAIGVCRRLWAEPEVEHHGEFFDFDRVAFEPKPVQRPVPVLIGGESGAALRRAERLGDGWLGMGHTPESVAPIVQRLRAARPNDARFTITVSADVRSAMDVERFADLGVDRLIVAPWRRSREAIDALQIFSSNLLT
jgi:probable F420-dependent oxidoreductase